MLKASSKLRGCAIFYKAVRVRMWNTAFWCILRLEGLFRLESAVPSSENDVMSVLCTFLGIVMAFCFLARRDCIVWFSRSDFMGMKLSGQTFHGCWLSKQYGQINIEWMVYCTRITCWHMKGYIYPDTASVFLDIGWLSRQAVCITGVRIQLSRDQRLKWVRRKVSQTKFFEGYEAGENFLVEGRDVC